MKSPAPSLSSPTPAVRPASQVVGLDIGGTKCAVSVLRGDAVSEVARFATRDFEPAWTEITAAIAAHRDAALTPRFGISCGGPLDARTGTILAPPNLPASWHGVPIVARLTHAFGGDAFLMNDANACALAEWHFGAGRGTQHMIFLTSGTGMGSGLILNGRLYEGATGDAGEIGHVRLRAEGPVGFGKAGSVEGFTSGGGIARLASAMLAGRNVQPAWFQPDIPLTTKQIALAAETGDPLALEIMHLAGERLGETLAILIDLFNPERIVIGGFFPRCRSVLEPALHAALERDALEIPRRACQIVPAQLGDTIGSHGAIAAALHASARE